MVPVPTVALRSLGGILLEPFRRLRKTPEVDVRCSMFHLAWICCMQCCQYFILALVA
jgi:hypothetical protein